VFAIIDWQHDHVGRVVFGDKKGAHLARGVSDSETYAREQPFRGQAEEGIPLVMENPYLLVRDIRGIGFKTADQIAQKLGMAQQQ